MALSSGGEPFSPACLTRLIASSSVFFFVPECFQCILHSANCALRWGISLRVSRSSHSMRDSVFRTFFLEWRRGKQCISVCDKSGRIAIPFDNSVMENADQSFSIQFDEHGPSSAALVNLSTMLSSTVLPEVIEADSTCSGISFVHVLSAPIPSPSLCAMTACPFSS
jgi:hypothetical protein